MPAAPTKPIDAPSFNAMDPSVSMDEVKAKLREIGEAATRRRYAERAVTETAAMGARLDAIDADRARRAAASRR